MIDVHMQQSRFSLMSASVTACTEMGVPFLKRLKTAKQHTGSHYTNPRSCYQVLTCELSGTPEGLLATSDNAASDVLNTETSAEQNVFLACQSTYILVWCSNHCRHFFFRLLGSAN